ncbi:autotransporter domain-containing protein [Polycladidibacter hongkongensis]|uniref:autotransporter domain-containing protein n=1 Tax=Polycladidibacter hongkongensis TaxID=1647556 RepID=UPI00082F08F7
MRFEAPAQSGPSVVFKKTSVTTDAEGNALAYYTTNGKAGEVTIKVYVAQQDPLEVKINTQGGVPDRVATPMYNAVTKLLTTRANRLISDQPELVNRLKGGPQGGIGNPLGFAATGISQSLTAQFETSLRSLMSFKAKDKKTQAEGALANFTAGEVLPDDFQGLDVWASGSFSRAKGYNSKSTVGMLNVGIDYRLDDSAVLGVLGQIDITKQSGDSSTYDADGLGWLVGPYGVFKLADNLFLDGRVAYGQSSNDINPLNTGAKTSFTTRRFLASGQLTGEFMLEGFTVNPFLNVSYLSIKRKELTGPEEYKFEQEDYSLGKAAFGPKVSRSIKLDDGAVLTPYVKVSGIWAFKELDSKIGTTLFGGEEDIHARVDGGFSYATGNGISVSGRGYYDGIGKNQTNAWGGSARVSLGF